MDADFEDAVTTKLQAFSMLSDKTREGTRFVSSKEAYFELAPLLKELMTAVSRDRSVTQLKEVSMMMKNKIAEIETLNKANESKGNSMQTNESNGR